MMLSKLFSDFFESERAAGIILIICTFVSLVISNTAFGEGYLHVWHFEIFSRSVEFWINDGLMTIFFLLVGLEMEREIYVGELSDIRKSMLPIIAALGGMMVPALIHLAFNYGTPMQKGFAIPMATDIAFSLAILSLLGSRVPISLKVFLTALAIIDDLGAIIVIALVYSKGFSLLYFSGAALLFLIMLVLNRLRFHVVWVYLLLGAVMWVLMYRSGIHATITGVLLAFVIPFGNGDEKSPSYGLQHRLHKPVAFLILPLFALANTSIQLPGQLFAGLGSANTYGIIAGLLVGKPMGIFLFSLAAIRIGAAALPEDLRKRHVAAVGMIAGIGFTMSIFITLLAFDHPETVTESKIAIILASVIAGILGYFALKMSLKRSQG
jgi:Na+:H+ antiporter, NhaA family